MKTEVVEQEKVKNKKVATGAGTLILLLLVAFAFAKKKKKEEPIAGWVSPTSFYDEYTRWLNEQNAYDKNIGTYCYTPSGTVYGWDPLELRLSNPVSGCDKVGIYCCGYQPGAISPAARISIELYYDNSWHEIFSGALEPTMKWVEVTNPAGAKTVSKARVKRLSTLKVYIYEFEFWGSLK